MLYGCNTLGAVMGALIGEIFLIDWLGVRGTGLVALCANVTAAAIAFALSPLFNLPKEQFEEQPLATRWSARGIAIMAAAFFAGGILLALEVIWFRLMLLFTFGTSLVFAVMLAVVLAGIGVGGVVASLWVKRQPAQAILPALACISGLLVVNQPNVRSNHGGTDDDGSRYRQSLFKGILPTHPQSPITRGHGDRLVAAAQP